MAQGVLFQMSECLKVTAWLASPLAGDPPMLCGLLQYEMAQREGKANKIRRDQPCPSMEDVHIPVLLRRFGNLSIPCCSSPILAPEIECVEHFAKRLATEHAGLLAEDRRLKVAIGNSTFKSYRLPLRIRLVRRVVWFVVAKRRPVLKLLRSVRSLGKKRSYGYGRVERWEAEPAAADWSVFAPCAGKEVLMRPLPYGDWLPENLTGYRRDFGACQPPYWHPNRWCESVTPCA